MPISIQPYKGARDFYPEDKRVQQFMFSTWRSVCERFGYEEYDGPLLEPLDLYRLKNQTNEEIVNDQVYSFTDRGDRQVAIRPEMTPTVSRMVAARRQELAYPLRWYSIPNLWRYERPQRGRLREHWQLNVDLFGVEGIEAEHEIIMLADSVMKAFGAKAEQYVIKVNSRKLVDAMISDYLGLDEVQASTLRRVIDRRSKMEAAAFAAATAAIFTPSQRDEGAVERLDRIMTVSSLAELPRELQESPASTRLKELVTLFEHDSSLNIVFDMSLMRGFDYYTDIVFEVFDLDPENNRSMFGGGRYDGLVGMFGVEPVPTVGFGMGDVTMRNFLESHNLLPQLTTNTEVYVILAGVSYQAALPTISKLREMGVNVAVDSTNRKVDKQLRSAVKKTVPYALFIGEKELADGRFKLRDLAKNSENEHALERIATIVKDYRTHQATDL